MDRSKESDPQFAFEQNAHHAADVIVALSFSSAIPLQTYWTNWTHWDNLQHAALPKAHELEGYHIVPPEILSRIRQGSVGELLAHQGDLEWLMDVVWDIKHHDESRPIPLPVEAADPYWTQKKWSGSAQVVICGMWVAKEIKEINVDEEKGRTLCSVIHQLPDFDIFHENQWLLEEINGLDTVEIIVVKGGTSKFNPNAAKTGHQQILKSFKWKRLSSSTTNSSQPIKNV